MATKDLTCHYSDLPSPIAYMMEEDDEATNADTKPIPLSELDINRIIEMAWEDRTPFEAIEAQFGLNEAAVKKLMKAQLKLSSYKLWRIRVQNCHNQTCQETDRKY